MNGIHDMGGMHGMGPIVREKDEPVFHEVWERRAFGMQFQMGFWDSFRYDLERIPPALYLRMSYYERWFTVLVNRLLKTNRIAAAELESGRADPSLPKPSPSPAPDRPADDPGGAARQNLRVTPRFKPGQRVRSRNIHPEGHTRQPRYTRGKRGTIVRDNGVFALQDTDADGQSLGGKPQHVYTVHFAARELWGTPASARDGVYVDLWEDYLERG